MHPLYNVIWQALTTRQQQFAEGDNRARRFMREVTLLGALVEDTHEGYSDFARVVGTGGTGALFLDEPYQPRAGWEYVAGAPLLQMVFENGENERNSAGGRDSRAEIVAENSPENSAEIVELGVQDSPEMIELTSLTKPGPFGTRTHELGTYLGIRREGKLVAMAGERLKVPRHTEVSAVCTHPDHTGNGYARVLMTEILRRIRDRGETPFLHVRGDNERAIAVYKLLGFRERKLGHFAVLRKV
jgi:ribosomal protein S18 acetylase RimI-like enzyme